MLFVKENDPCIDPEFYSKPFRLFMSELFLDFTLIAWHSKQLKKGTMRHSHIYEHTWFSIIFNYIQASYFPTELLVLAFVIWLCCFTRWRSLKSVYSMNTNWNCKSNLQVLPTWLVWMLVLSSPPYNIIVFPYTVCMFQTCFIRYFKQE